MNTTLTIRTTNQTKKVFSKFAKSKGFTLSAMLNNYMLTKPAEDVADKHMDEEKMTIKDFIALQKAMQNFRQGNYTTKDEYEKKRFGKKL